MFNFGLDRRGRRQAGGGDGGMARLDRDPRLWPRCRPLRRNSHADHSRRFAGSLCPPSLARIDWLARLHNANAGVPYGIALAAAGLCNSEFIHLGCGRLEPTSTLAVSTDCLRIGNAAVAQRRPHLIVARERNHKPDDPRSVVPAILGARRNHFISVIPNTERYPLEGANDNSRFGCSCVKPDRIIFSYSSSLRLQLAKVIIALSSEYQGSNGIKIEDFPLIDHLAEALAYNSIL